MTSESIPSADGRAPADTTELLRGRLSYLYGDRAEEALTTVQDVLSRYQPAKRQAGWSERDIVLITYGDQVRRQEGPALGGLQEFLTSSGLVNWINTVHLLPFYPFSSDDGFSVIDYRQVQPEIGDWDDVRELSEHVQLMFDLVLNHCSQHSEWFQKYLSGDPVYQRYFIEADPKDDLSAVTRPRSLPLLTAYDTSRGERHLWTTFSADQVDLNFADPTVLAEFLDILLFYVEQGARIIRLDAIAYLWKQLGTNCIHLQQTHEVVKLMRDVLDALAPHVLLLTETNVPHAENVSYFGDGDEAHMVYQFSLPPLLLDGFLSGDANGVRSWLQGLDTTPAGTTFFNFTASHDGVGIRPLEGLVSADRFDQLVAAARERGSLVGMRGRSDGSETPYELNVTYVDALGEPDGLDAEVHARRFLSSQAVMLALPGVPGIYFHSLVGTQNDLEGVRESGIPRRINRRKFELSELRQILSDPTSLQAKIFEGYQLLLKVRTQQPAFHPDGGCELMDLGEPSLLAFCRSSCDGAQRILCITNLAGQSVPFQLPSGGQDLLSLQRVAAGSTNIEAYQTMWIELEGRSPATSDDAIHA